MFPRERLLRRLTSLDFDGHDEQSIREQWVFPLLGLLGYGDPLTRVDIPFKVDLADPVRAIGHHRYEVDYRPTVHGMGMWIIEAKRPAEDLFSQQHLGQAWSYATHPEIDVPFMVMANGQRICVYDITQAEWDKDPTVDIAQAELENEFGHLNEALGARNVAEFVRRRQLRHLRTALMAQLDDEALETTLKDVEAIVDEARPEVQRNRSQASFEAFEEAMAERERSAREIGVSGMAQSCISPNAPIGAEVVTCAQLIRELGADARAAAFDEFTDAARIDGTIRMTFSLRVLRLAVALLLVDDEACGDRARDEAEEVAREAATALADDPVGAAAHDFERVLPAFIARLALIQSDEAVRIADEFKNHLDVREWIRQNAEFGLEPGAFLDRRIELAFRAVWSSFGPWTEDALRETTANMRTLLAQIQVHREIRVGQVGNAFYEMHLIHDPLWPGARNVIKEVADPPRWGDQTPEVTARSEFASELLDRYFSGPPPEPVDADSA